VKIMQSENMGTLYGIGVGPGDSELLTLKGYRLLQECNVIAYPKKNADENSYALGIVREYVNQTEKTMLGLVFPMTRNRAILEPKWRETVETVWGYLSKGQDVAFVTEGDPMVFSTFIHLGRLLKELYPQAKVKSVPGVSSFHAAASQLQVPFADGDDSVAIVPATRDMEQMKRMLELHDCIVFIKIAKVFDTILDLLTELGLEKNAFVVTKVTGPDEMIWTDASELRGKKLGYLTLMVVRK
jgi:precorrin-2/cobalt-factor-2 C20-methyltransferase